MIIFDLDQTLVDTSQLAALRRQGGWSRLMQRLDEIEAYGGVDEMLRDLHKRGETLAIFTHSPDMVPKALVKRFGWPISIIVGFHQAGARKPAPNGLRVAMEQGGATPADTIHVGDQAHDTAASKAAKVTSVGVTWGIPDSSELEASEPDHLFDSVKKLHAFLAKRASK